MLQSKGIVRLSLNASILLVTAFAAHLTAGGDFRSFPELIAQSCLVLITLLLAGKRELQGPVLALLILFSQSAVHFILGGSSGNSTLMAIAHTTAGIIAYQLVSRVEKIGEAIINFRRNAISLFKVFVPDSKVNFAFPIFMEITFSFQSLINVFHGLRAPPKAVLNV